MKHMFMIARLKFALLYNLNMWQSGCYQSHQ